VGLPSEQFVFKNPTKDWGIVMSKGAVSFHFLKDYAGWATFRDELICPFYKLYLELGLDNGLRNCTVMYLNRFEKQVSERLSEYFTIVSDIDKKFYPEKNTIVQRLFKGPDDQILVTKLTAQDIVGGKYQINLECGAVSTGNMNWLEQAEKTHGPILNFFDSIITEKQKKDL
jgi:uncharacterized protein (TIGR04255 family)